MLQAARFQISLSLCAVSEGQPVLVLLEGTDCRAQGVYQIHPHAHTPISRGEDLREATQPISLQIRLISSREAQLVTRTGAVKMAPRLQEYLKIFTFRRGHEARGAARLVPVDSRSEIGSWCGMKTCSGGSTHESSSQSLERQAYLDRLVHSQQRHRCSPWGTWTYVTSTEGGVRGRRFLGFQLTLPPHTGNLESVKYPFLDKRYFFGIWGQKPP